MSEGIDPVYHDPIEYVYYKSDPLVTPSYGLDNLDPGLAEYYGYSEAEKADYDLDTKNLAEKFDETKKELQEQLSENTNLQGGSFSGVYSTASLKSSGTFPVGLVLFGLILWWLYG